MEPPHGIIYGVSGHLFDLVLNDVSNFVFNLFEHIIRYSIDPLGDALLRACAPVLNDTPTDINHLLPGVVFGPFLPVGL